MAKRVHYARRAQAFYSRRHKTGGFRCPGCKGLTTVKDSRTAEYGVRRRRLCVECGRRFTTREIAFDADELLTERHKTVERLRVALQHVAELMRELDQLEESLRHE